LLFEEANFLSAKLEQLAFIESQQQFRSSRDKIPFPSVFCDLNVQP